MRNPARIRRILDKVEAVWINNPDLRLGQLLIDLAPASFHNDIFYLEDDELEVEIDKYIEDFINKRSDM